MQTPIYTKLKAYHSENRVTFAMPGHKNARGLTAGLAELDTTELDATVDLHHGCSEVYKSQKMLSEFYKSGESRYLAGGSTAGIHAWVSANFKSGDTIAANRNCHISLVNICALLGVDIVMIPNRIRETFHTPVPPESIPFLQFPEIKGVFITSPTYYGECADIYRISKECKKRGIPLFVDEAHGAHFISSDAFPKTAMEQGADVSVQSAHKTLDALTGAAFLHMREKSERLIRAVSMVQTSSPSYPIVASAELAWTRLADGGYWDKTIERCVDFRKRCPCEVMDNDDVTRLVIHFEKMSGYEAQSQLAGLGIDMEMADETNVVAIASPSNTAEDFELLLNALYSMRDINTGYSADFSDPVQCPVKISPQKGYWGEAGYSDRNIYAYPPGTPVIAMGEIIEENRL